VDPKSVYPSSGSKDGLEINAGGGDFLMRIEWRMQLDLQGPIQAEKSFPIQNPPLTNSSYTLYVVSWQDSPLWMELVVWRF